MSHVKSINIEALTSAKSEMAKILNTRALNVADVSRVMSLAFGGTDAAGAWDWRMGFDVMQAAALEIAGARLGSASSAQAGLSVVECIAASLPTETRRTERQMQLQQFTTAMPWGWIVAQAADPQAGDVLLEPSAGTGCLAALAEAAGSQTARSTPELILNEIDPTRAALLAQLTGKTVTAHDAEFIDDLLARELAPTLVVMNPPFASSVARSSDSTIAMRHVLSAAKRLCEGGRLVAIVPPGVSAERGGALWARLCEEVTPVLRLTLPRSAFARMGTSVETHLLIADKPTAKTEPLARTREARFVVGSPSDALDLLSCHLPARQPLAKPVALSNRLKASAPKPRAFAQDAISAARPKMLLPASGSLAARAHSSTAMVPLNVNVFDIARSNEALSDVYARYAPQRISIKGAKAHPTVLVESLAMASVAAPAPSEGACELSLPERLVGEGLLSEAQLETVIMAETAFGHDLPGRFSVTEKNLLQRADEDAQAHTFRKGYFLGDGTGCGKGRQVAGLILAGWGAGRRKALWVSRSATLVEDAIRDWCDLGGARTDIHALSKWSGDDDLKLREGILFTTYATLRAVAQSGKTRLDQVLSWLGEDFDGLIAFDEAHAMQNAGGSSSARGAAAPSQQGLAGLRLQNALPRARVLYVSATGATEVSNLAYASRLGLWGAGLDYPFPSREGFVEAMEAGGVAAMEVVARDLKALGLYTARALSFDGVEYDILEHALSEDQIGVYDAWAAAFKTIHNNLNAALEATGITARDDGSAEAGSGSAKAAAISAFESTKQRFFGHLLQGMKAKSVIAAIEADVTDGWAPVVQIVSTGEALLKRRLETLAPDEELAEASLTPRDYVLGYLQNAFPVMQMQRVEQEDGSVIAEPFRDENGNLVVSREAERLRDELMEDLLLLAPVPSALDQLVWAFGPERIAEVTGRSVRPIKQSDGSLKVERRAASANSAETQAFMGGEKDILIFSDAGGTGRSYQAAQTAVNQKRRRHYLLEPGWRADNAIQGLGRTHRAAQVSAPYFRVCTTDVHGEKRFTSTIARRLDTLGALTKGQRETASQGMFRAEDNLESPIARGCLRGLFRDIVTGRDAVMGLDQFTAWTGLKLTTQEGQMLDELPPIQRFLNRILALPIAMQNLLFSDFMERIRSATERARAAGTLDVGLEELRGDSLKAGAPETLCVDARTGAVTSLIPITVETELTYQTVGAVMAGLRKYVPMQNTSSGKVALIAPAPRHVFDDLGEFSLERRIVRPVGKSWMEEGKFGRSQWEPITDARLRSLWDAEVAELPSRSVEELYLLTGLILPIWKDIPGTTSRIYRAKCEGGETYLGRALTAGEAGVLRARFIEVDVADADAVYAAVVEGGQRVEIAGGLSLALRRVASQKRLEISGADRDTLDWLRSLGCFTEIHQFTLRAFVPYGEGADTLGILRNIVGASENAEAA